MELTKLSCSWHDSQYYTHFKMTHAEFTNIKNRLCQCTLLKVVPWFSCTGHAHLHHAHHGIWPHQRQHGDREAHGGERMKSLIGDGERWREGCLSISLPPRLSLYSVILYSAKPSSASSVLTEWVRWEHTQAQILWFKTLCLGIDAESLSSVLKFKEQSKTPPQETPHFWLNPGELAIYYLSKPLSLSLFFLILNVSTKDSPRVNLKVVDSKRTMYLLNAYRLIIILFNITLSPTTYSCVI